MSTPAEELRAAAARLREFAKDTTPADGDPSGWLGTVNDDTGVAYIYGGPTDTAGYRTGVVFEFEDDLDCECVRPSMADLNWMWLMSPLLAEPLAAWLEATAADMDAWEHGVVEGSASRKVHPGSPLGFGLMKPREDWTAALAVARVILGRPS